MPAPPPIISVIVVCQNPGPRLRVALASVWAQHGPPPELIVIDGASTDGTREWLEAQRARLATLVSEPDAGVYDAMNKGLAVARGEWVLFLGADDRLDGDNVLSEAGAYLKSLVAGVIAGEVIYDDGRRYPFGPQLNLLARNFVHHQAAFYRRTLFTEHGGFDPAFAIMADYEFNLRLWTKRVRFERLALRLAVCGTHGLSDAGRWRGYAEEIRVRHRYFPSWKCWCWDVLSLVRFLRKKFLRALPRRHG